MKNLQIEIIELLEISDSSEHICLLHKQIIFFISYFPPWMKAEEVSATFDSLISNIDRIQTKYPYTELCLLGDYNRTPTHLLCNHLNVVNIVNECTRLNAILDCCFVSKESKDSFKATVGPPLGKSDHNSVYIHYSKSLEDKQKQYHMLYDYRQSNLRNFNEEIGGINWAQMYMLQTTDEKTKFFHDSLTSALQKVPKIQVYTTNTDKKWLSALCKHLINERWKAFRAKNFDLYRHYKKKVQEEIKTAKSTWCESLKNRGNGIWNLVKKNTPKKHIDIECLRNADESLQSFCERVNEILISNYTSPSSPGTNVPFSECITNEFFPDLTESEIYKGLSMLKRKKATGSDNIPNIFLSTCAHLISQPVLHLFTSILHSTTFPSLWKCANVVPLPKCNPPALNKLRPISLLPNISKLFEKIILSSLQPFFFNYIDTDQHGFMPKRSTSTCLIRIHDTLTSLLDQPSTKAVTMISFDLQKAFDSVPHSLLLSKLSSFIPHNMLRLISSYLTGRTQRVTIKKAFSSSRPIPSGVPQGAILSPLLFNAFFNDLKFKGNSSMFKYADDVTLIIWHKDSNITDEINERIFEMAKWCNNHRLTLNSNKTQIMTIKKNSATILHPLHLNQIKILGVYFNEKLKWSTQIQSIAKRASQRIYILRQLKHHLSKKQLLQLYKSIIEPLFTYACQLYIILPQSLNNLLNKVFKRCHYFICHPHCKCHIISSPSFLRQHHSIQLFYKAEADPMHPIHSLIPEKLKVTKKYRQPLALTERRKLAFIPTITEIANNT